MEATTSKKKPRKHLVVPPHGTHFYLKMGGVQASESVNPMVFYKDKDGIERKLEFREYGHAVKVHRGVDRKRRIGQWTAQVNQSLKNAGSSIVIKEVDVDNGRTNIGKLFLSKTSPEDAAKSLIAVPVATESTTSDKKSKSKKNRKSSKSKKSTDESTESDDDSDLDNSDDDDLDE
jgi:hypothetical protein